MLKRISITNFRALKSIQVDFEETLTMIVGENDCGKSTIIDAIKICCGELSSLTPEDFNDSNASISILGEFNNLSVKHTFSINNSVVEHELKKIFSVEHVSEHKALLEKLIEIEDPDEKTKKIRELATLYSLNVRSNSRDDTLIEQLEEKFDDPDISTDGISIRGHEEQFYCIGGQEFDDLSSFVEQFFFIDKRNDIWSENISDDGPSIEDYINNELSSYSANLRDSIKESGILEKVKKFKPGVDDIKIEASLEKKAINLDVDVKFMENGEEALVDNLGDGSKRRITMALLDLKKDQSNEEPSIYAFDEPEVHLHVSAQLELLETIEELTAQGKQCIITTHSPFMMNATPSRKIRVINLSEDGGRTISQIKTASDVEYTLQRLGIQNTNLFFSKRIILVEGKTEKAFVPLAFQRKFGVPLNSKLTNVIDVKGINNIPGFAAALTMILDTESVFILMDNDGTENLDRIIDELNIPDCQVCRIGNKEFEDSFTDNQLYQSWKEYVSGNIGETWCEFSIAQCREECDEEGKKFSKEIKTLNRGGSKMTKPELGQALASYVDPDQYPEAISTFLNRFSEL